MFKTGELIKHEVWNQQIYVIIDENCGSPDIIGSTKGFAKINFLYSLDPHYEHVKSYTIRYIAHRILNSEWWEAADEFTSADEVL